MLTKNNRCFGVEFEFSKFDDTDFDGFEAEYEHCGREYVSDKMSGSADLAKVRRLADYATEDGWESDSNCGLHVHVDCEDLDVSQLKSVAYAYLLTRGVWESCVAPRRLSTHWCRRTYYNRGELEALRTKSDFYYWADCRDRYNFINWKALGRHNTVELRGHEGTTCGESVCNWITAHVEFVEYVKDKDFAELEALFGVGGGTRSKTAVNRIIGTEVAAFFTKKSGRKMPVITIRPIVRNRTISS